MSGILKAPFPYFGGKAMVASVVWSRLGDCAHYIEPFFGSGAVLLARPDYDPTRHTETIVDKDGHICNVWRALQADPDEVSRWCDWPVSHYDLSARRRALNEAYPALADAVCADPDYYDAKLAGYYIWATSQWIGGGLASLTARPHLTDAGKGAHAKGQIPHLAHAGNGVHAKGRIPHLGNAGVQGPYTPAIYDWFRALSERLRRVRIVGGDWTRVCGGQWQDGQWPSVGLFFDPPYSDKAGRTPQIYAEDSLSVAHAVRQWCLERGCRKTYRIVLAGYYEEHAELLAHGWTVHRWSAPGGYANIARKGPTRGRANRHKEALFFSPHCRGGAKTLFGDEEEVEYGVTR
jgi:DNA adenine methylase